MSFVVEPQSNGVLRKSPPANVRRVTVKDVALRAGVAHASVSVVLNGAKSNTHVSESARERILQAAHELGYQRNSAVAAMQTGRFGCLALLLSTTEHSSSLPQRMLDGILDELARHNLHLTIGKLPDDKLTDEGIVPKILREWMADGLLIDYTDHIPEKMIGLIRHHSLPAVWINSRQEADCVYPDDYHAGCSATQHLLGLGHQRISYVDFTHDFDDPGIHYSALARRDGYLQAMSEVRNRQVLNKKHASEENSISSMMRLLSQPKRPTAIIGYGHEEIGGALIAAAKLGLHVPQDLSVLTFGGADKTTSCSVPVTMMIVPEYEVGQAAARMLLRKIDTPDSFCRVPPQKLQFHLSLGATSAPIEKGTASRRCYKPKPGT